MRRGGAGLAASAGRGWLRHNSQGVLPDTSQHVFAAPHHSGSIDRLVREVVGALPALRVCVVPERDLEGSSLSKTNQIETTV